MKTFSNLPLYLFLGLSLVLNAQNKNSKSQSGIEASIIKTDDAKANFIKDQNYLYSASGQKDYRNFYGDSLKGFDETAVKAELVNHNVYGKEYLGYIGKLRRDFINKKYNIGVYGTKPLQAVYAPPSQSASRPGGGANTINIFPCVNEDFELTTPGAYTTGGAVAGWSVTSRSRTTCGFTGPFLSGSPEFSVMATPIQNVLPIGNVLNIASIGTSPLGGNNVVLLNDQVANNNEIETKISQTFPVTNANTLFQFAFAGLWQDGGHFCCEQPALKIEMFDCGGNPLACSSLSLNAFGLNCLTGATGYSTTTSNWSWTNWQSRFIDLTPYIGSCVTIEITNSDCIFGGHPGSVYIDARCGGALVGTNIPGTGNIPSTVGFCAGSNQATIQAPPGYSTYQWFAPGNPPVAVSPTLGGNTASVVIPNPVAGTVYTVQLITASNCTFVSVDTLKFTSVQIIGLGSNPSCPGGASGSAIVLGNGSGTGYSYTWTAVGSNVAISSASIATGLLPGTYSVNIAGFGAAGCGSAAATVTVGTSAPLVYTVIKPFCGNTAYLSAQGSNFQWYGGNPLAAIPFTANGTSSLMPVASPYHGQSIWLTYTSPQGCRDSVNFILNQVPSGSLYVQNISYACPGVANANAEVVMTPASGSPPGVNSFSVWSTNSVPPYSSSTPLTSANIYSATGMAAGTYSVNAFDGSCYYSTTFVVNPYLYNYAVSPVTSTLCPGNNIIAGVSFNSAITPNQYSFNWSPSTWIVGGALNATNISVQIAPVVPIGSVVTTVYTITVNPAIVNCPITKTISVTAANLAIPAISSPAPFCTNASNKTISVTPAGNYTFSTGGGNWLNPSTGVITPGNLVNSIGTNTFMVSASVSTCMVSNVGNIDVSKFNSAALSGIVPAKCSTDPCVNLMGIVPPANQVNGAWTGFGVSSNQFCPNLPTGVYTLNYNTTSNPNPILCPDVSTISIAVSQTVAPFITPQAPFCTNKPSFNMLVTPTGGTWSGGSPQLITPAGVVNPQWALTGNNTITYIVNTGACVNVATSVLNATTFRSAALTGGIPELCVNSSAIPLMSIVQNQANNGTWSGAGVSGNIFNPLTAIQGATQTPTGQGNYTFALHYNTTSTPNPTVCPDSRTIVVNVLKPSLPTIVQPAPHCNADAPFQIGVSPNTGSFTPTAYLTANGLFTPSLCPVGNNMIYYTIGTTNCNVQDAKQVSIEAFVPSTITGGLPEQCSTNAAVDLSNLTVNNSGNWVGSGMVGSSFNPAISGAGNIILTYKTSSFPSGLCPSQSILSVQVYSLATPTIEDEGPFCNSKAQSVKLRVSPLGGLFSGENNRAVDVNGFFSPVNAQIGDNIINYSITAGPCVAYAQKTIKVERFISPDFSRYVGPFCRNEQPFDLSTAVQNSGGVFSNYAGLGLTGSSMYNPANGNLGNNNLVIYTTHSMPTASLCPDSAMMRIQINEIPNVSVASNVNKGCAPVEVVFNSPNSAGGKGEWTLGDGSDPIRGLTVNHTYTASGTYSVVFNYWDELGCSTQALLETPVTVYGNPVAGFSYGPYGDDLTISDPEVQFTNVSTVLGGNTYQWQIDNMYSTTDVNPTVVFPKIGKYEITLTAIDINGCKDKISQVIEIKNDFGVYIPNTFTPNEDGTNDVFIPVFTPYGLDAKTFDMEIFDRWGTSLYHSKDASKGWNGSNQNKSTEPLKQEVYVYKIKFKDLNGITYNRLGHITLLR